MIWHDASKSLPKTQQNVVCWDGLQYFFGWYQKNDGWHVSQHCKLYALNAPTVEVTRWAKISFNAPTEGTR